MTRQADRNAERQDPKGLGPEGMRAAVCEADAPNTYLMDKTVEVSQAARELALCPFCGGKVTFVQACSEGDPDWIMHVAKVGGVDCGIQEFSSFTSLRPVSELWNERVAQPTAALIALRPFADALDEWGDDPSHFDRGSVWEHPIAMNITLGDFREAHRVYAASGMRLREATTRATQPEAALREALEGEAQVYFPPELDKELARIEWPRSRSLLHEAALFCGRVQVLNGDARLTAQAVDLGDRLRAALKDHRHG